jgi:hypothetical protein
MTEAEAYGRNLWPEDGLVGGKPSFVLPLSGCTRTDWVVVRCSNCDMRGVSVFEAMQLKCMLCEIGNQLVWEI